MTLVVDASVACKWFIAEPQSDLAETLLHDGTALLAPDLIVPEVCNVACLKLRRGEITADQARTMIEGRCDILDEVIATTTLAARAFEIASAVGHPAYDCFYIALAEQCGSQLVTAERRLLTRMSGTDWARLLVSLEESRSRAR